MTNTIEETNENTALLDPMDSVNTLLSLNKTKFRTAAVVNGKKTIDKLSEDLDHCVLGMLPVEPEKLDMTIPAHRDAVRSAAYKLSQSKKPIQTKIDSCTKELKDEIASFKNFAETAIDMVAKKQVETRKPLTEYELEQERIEQERKDKHRQQIDDIIKFGDLTGNEDRETLLGIYEAVQSIEINKENFEEFQIEAMEAQSEVIKKLDDAIAELTLQERLKDEADSRKAAQKLQKQSEDYARFTNLPVTMMNSTIEEVQAQIKRLENFEPSADVFGAYAEQIKQQLPNTISMLRMIAQNKQQQAESVKHVVMEMEPKEEIIRRAIDSVEVPQKVAEAFKDNTGATTPAHDKNESVELTSDDEEALSELSQYFSFEYSMPLETAKNYASALLLSIKSGRIETLSLNY